MRLFQVDGTGSGSGGRRPTVDTHSPNVRPQNTPTQTNPNSARPTSVPVQNTAASAVVGEAGSQLSTLVGQRLASNSSSRSDQQTADQARTQYQETLNQLNRALHRRDENQVRSLLQELRTNTQQLRAHLHATGAALLRDLQLLRQGLEIQAEIRRAFPLSQNLPLDPQNRVDQGIAEVRSAVQTLRDRLRTRVQNPEINQRVNRQLLQDAATLPLLDRELRDRAGELTDTRLQIQLLNRAGLREFPRNERAATYLLLFRSLAELRTLPATELNAEQHRDSGILMAELRGKILQNHSSLQGIPDPERIQSLEGLLTRVEQGHLGPREISSLLSEEGVNRYIQSRHQALEAFTRAQQIQDLPARRNALVEVLGSFSRLGDATQARTVWTQIENSFPWVDRGVERLRVFTAAYRAVQGTGMDFQGRIGNSIEQLALALAGETDLLAQRLSTNRAEGLQRARAVIPTEVAGLAQRAERLLAVQESFASLSESYQEFLNPARARVNHRLWDLSGQIRAQLRNPPANLSLQDRLLLATRLVQIGRSLGAETNIAREGALAEGLGFWQTQGELAAARARSERLAASYDDNVDTHSGSNKHGITIADQQDAERLANLARANVRALVAQDLTLLRDLIPQAGRQNMQAAHREGMAEYIRTLAVYQSRIEGGQSVLTRAELQAARDWNALGENLAQLIQPQFAQVMEHLSHPATGNPPSPEVLTQLRGFQASATADVQAAFQSALQRGDVGWIESHLRDSGMRDSIQVSLIGHRLLHTATERQALGQTEQELGLRMRAAQAFASEDLRSASRVNEALSPIEAYATQASPGHELDWARMMRQMAEVHEQVGSSEAMTNANRVLGHIHDLATQVRNRHETVPADLQHLDEMIPALQHINRRNWEQAEASLRRITGNELASALLDQVVMHRQMGRSSIAANVLRAVLANAYQNRLDASHAYEGHVENFEGPLNHFINRAQMLVANGSCVNFEEAIHRVRQEPAFAEDVVLRDFFASPDRIPTRVREFLHQSSDMHLGDEQVRGSALSLARDLADPGYLGEFALLMDAWSRGDSNGLEFYDRLATRWDNSTSGWGSWLIRRESEVREGRWGDLGDWFLQNNSADLAGEREAHESRYVSASQEIAQSLSQDSAWATQARTFLTRDLTDMETVHQIGEEVRRNTLIAANTRMDVMYFAISTGGRLAGALAEARAVRMATASRAVAEVGAAGRAATTVATTGRGLAASQRMLISGVVDPLFNNLAQSMNRFGELHRDANLGDEVGGMARELGKTAISAAFAVGASRGFQVAGHRLARTQTLGRVSLAGTRELRPVARIVYGVTSFYGGEVGGEMLGDRVADFVLGGHSRQFERERGVNPQVETSLESDIVTNALGEIFGDVTGGLSHRISQRLRTESSQRNLYHTYQPHLIQMGYSAQEVQNLYDTGQLFPSGARRGPLHPAALALHVFAAHEQAGSSPEELRRHFENGSLQAAARQLGLNPESTHPQERARAQRVMAHVLAYADAHQVGTEEAAQRLSERTAQFWAAVDTQHPQVEQNLQPQILEQMASLYTESARENFIFNSMGIGGRVEHLVTRILGEEFSQSPRAQSLAQSFLSDLLISHASPREATQQLESHVNERLEVVERFIEAHPELQFPPRSEATSVDQADLRYGLLRSLLGREGNASELQRNLEQSISQVNEAYDSRYPPLPEAQGSEPYRQSAQTNSDNRPSRLVFAAWLLSQSGGQPQALWSVIQQGLLRYEVREGRIFISPPASATPPPVQMPTRAPLPLSYRMNTVSQWGGAVPMGVTGDVGQTFVLGFTPVPTSAEEQQLYVRDFRAAAEETENEVEKVSAQSGDSQGQGDGHAGGEGRGEREEGRSVEVTEGVTALHRTNIVLHSLADRFLNSGEIPLGRERALADELLEQSHRHFAEGNLMEGLRYLAALHRSRVAERDVTILDWLEGRLERCIKTREMSFIEPLRELIEAAEFYESLLASKPINIFLQSQIFSWLDLSKIQSFETCLEIFSNLDEPSWVYAVGNLARNPSLSSAYLERLIYLVEQRSTLSEQERSDLLGRLCRHPNTPEAVLDRVEQDLINSVSNARHLLNARLAIGDHPARVARDRTRLIEEYLPLARRLGLKALEEALQNYANLNREQILESQNSPENFLCEKILPALAEHITPILGVSLEHLPSIQSHFDSVSVLQVFLLESYPDKIPPSELAYTYVQEVVRCFRERNGHFDFLYMTSPRAVSHFFLGSRPTYASYLSQVINNIRGYRRLLGERWPDIFLAQRVLVSRFQGPSGDHFHLVLERGNYEFFNGVRLRITSNDQVSGSPYLAQIGLTFGEDSVDIVNIQGFKSDTNQVGQKLENTAAFDQARGEIHPMDLMIALSIDFARRAGVGKIRFIRGTAQFAYLDSQTTHPTKEDPYQSRSRRFLFTPDPSDSDYLMLDLSQMTDDAYAQYLATVLSRPDPSQGGKQQGKVSNPASPQVRVWRERFSGLLGEMHWADVEDASASREEKARTLSRGEKARTVFRPTEERCSSFSADVSTQVSGVQKIRQRVTHLGQSAAVILPGQPRGLSFHLTNARAEVPATAQNREEVTVLRFEGEGDNRRVIVRRENGEEITLPLLEELQAREGDRLHLFSLPAVAGGALRPGEPGYEPTREVESPDTSIPGTVDLLRGAEVHTSSGRRAWIRRLLQSRREGWNAELGRNLEALQSSDPQARSRSLYELSRLTPHLQGQQKWIAFVAVFESMRSSDIPLRLRSTGLCRALAREMNREAALEAGRMLLHEIQNAESEAALPTPLGILGELMLNPKLPLAQHTECTKALMAPARSESAAVARAALLALQNAFGRLSRREQSEVVNLVSELLTHPYELIAQRAQEVWTQISGNTSSTPGPTRANIINESMNPLADGVSAPEGIPRHPFDWVDGGVIPGATGMAEGERVPSIPGTEVPFGARHQSRGIVPGRVESPVIWRGQPRTLSFHLTSASVEVPATAQNLEEVTVLRFEGEGENRSVVVRRASGEEVTLDLIEDMQVSAGDRLHLFSLPRVAGGAGPRSFRIHPDAARILEPGSLYERELQRARAWSRERLVHLVEALQRRYQGVFEGMDSYFFIHQPFLSHLNVLVDLFHDRGWNEAQQQRFMESVPLWATHPRFQASLRALFRDPHLSFEEIVSLFGQIHSDETRVLVEDAVFDPIRQNVRMIQLAAETLGTNELSASEHFLFYRILLNALSGKRVEASLTPELRNVFDRFLEQQAEDLQARGGRRRAFGDEEFHYHLFLGAMHASLGRAREALAQLTEASRTHHPSKRQLLEGLLHEMALASGEVPPPLVQDGDSVPENPSWMNQALEHLVNEALAYSESFTPLSLPLRDVIPLHYPRHPEEAGIALERLNSIRAQMLLRLRAMGWRAGERPSPEMLENILREWDANHSLPVVSKPDRRGRRILLNGHHRIIALMSLVREGILPREVLELIPFLEETQTEGVEVLRAGRSRIDRRGMNFGWPQALAFNRALATLAQEVGATGQLQEVGSARDTGVRQVSDTHDNASRPSSVTELARVARSSQGQEYSYRVRMRSLETLVDLGRQEEVIAVRESSEGPSEIRLEVTSTQVLRYRNAVAPAESRMFSCKIREGEGRGYVDFYLQPDGTLTVEYINTREGISNLGPGVASIVLNWLASQAAFRGAPLEFARIGNPRIVEMIARDRLLASQEERRDGEYVTLRGPASRHLLSSRGGRGSTTAFVSPHMMDEHIPGLDHADSMDPTARARERVEGRTGLASIDNGQRDGGGKIPDHLRPENLPQNQEGGGAEQMRDPVATYVLQVAAQMTQAAGETFKVMQTRGLLARLFTRPMAAVARRLRMLGFSPEAVQMIVGVEILSAPEVEAKARAADEATRLPGRRERPVLGEAYRAIPRDPQQVSAQLRARLNPEQTKVAEKICSSIGSRLGITNAEMYALHREAIRDSVAQAILEGREAVVRELGSRSFTQKLRQILAAAGLPHSDHLSAVLVRQILDHAENPQQARDLAQRYLRFAEAVAREGREALEKRERMETVADVRPYLRENVFADLFASPVTVREAIARLKSRAASANVPIPADGQVPATTNNLQNRLNDALKNIQRESDTEFFTPGSNTSYYIDWSRMGWEHVLDLLQQHSELFTPEIVERVRGLIPRATVAQRKLVASVEAQLLQLASQAPAGDVPETRATTRIRVETPVQEAERLRREQAEREAREDEVERNEGAASLRRRGLGRDDEGSISVEHLLALPVQILFSPVYAAVGLVRGVAALYEGARALVQAHQAEREALRVQAQIRRNAELAGRPWTEQQRVLLSQAGILNSTQSVLDQLSNFLARAAENPALTQHREYENVLRSLIGRARNYVDRSRNIQDENRARQHEGLTRLLRINGRSSTGEPLPSAPPSGRPVPVRTTEILVPGTKGASGAWHQAPPLVQGTVRQEGTTAPTMSVVMRRSSQGVSSAPTSGSLSENWFDHPNIAGTMRIFARRITTEGGSSSDELYADYRSLIERANQAVDEQVIAMQTLSPELQRAHDLLLQLRSLVPGWEGMTQEEQDHHVAQVITGLSALRNHFQEVWVPGMGEPIFDLVNRREPEPVPVPLVREVPVEQIIERRRELARRVTEDPQAAKMISLLSVAQRQELLRRIRHGEITSVEAALACLEGFHRANPPIEILARSSVTARDVLERNQRAAAEEVLEIDPLPDQEPTAAADESIWERLSAQAMHPVVREILRAPEGTSRPDLRPNLRQQIGSHTFYAGPVIHEEHPADGIRTHVLLLVDVNGELQMRHFYRSNSGGGWRYAPVMVAGWAFKGSHYTASTEPAPEMVMFLENLERTASHVNMQHEELIQFTELGGRHLDSDTASLAASVALSSLGEFDRSTRAVSTPSLAPISRYRAGKVFQGAPQTSGELLVALRDLQYPEGFIPNFRQAPSRTYVRQHTLLGPITIEEYRGAVLEGRPVVWSMARDVSGRMWVQSLHFADSAVNSYGLYSDPIDAGVLTSKPLDYNKHVRMLLGTTYVQPFNETYQDITPALNLLRPLREYREALAEREAAVPDASVPDTSVPDTSVPDTSVPGTGASVRHAIPPEARSSVPPAEVRIPSAPVPDVASLDAAAYRTVDLMNLVGAAEYREVREFLNSFAGLLSLQGGSEEANRLADQISGDVRSSGRLGDSMRPEKVQRLERLFRILQAVQGLSEGQMPQLTRCDENVLRKVVRAWQEGTLPSALSSSPQASPEATPLVPSSGQAAGTAPIRRPRVSAPAPGMPEAARTDFDLGHSLPTRNPTGQMPTVASFQILGTDGINFLPSVAAPDPIAYLNQSGASEVSVCINFEDNSIVLNTSSANHQVLFRVVKQNNTYRVIPHIPPRGEGMPLYRGEEAHLQIPNEGEVLAAGEQGIRIGVLMRVNLHIPESSSGQETGGPTSLPRNLPSLCALAGAALTYGREALSQSLTSFQEQVALLGAGAAALFAASAFAVATYFWLKSREGISGRQVNTLVPPPRVNLPPAQRVQNPVQQMPVSPMPANAPSIDRSHLPFASQLDAQSHPVITQEMQEAQQHGRAVDMERIISEVLIPQIQEHFSPSGDYAHLVTQGIDPRHPVGEDAIGRYQYSNAQGQRVVTMLVSDGMGGMGNGDVAAQLSLVAFEVELQRSGNEDQAWALANAAVNCFNHFVQNGMDAADARRSAEALTRRGTIPPEFRSPVPRGSGACSVSFTVVPPAVIGQPHVLHTRFAGDAAVRVFRRGADGQWRRMYATREEGMGATQADIQNVSARRTMMIRLNDRANIVLNGLGIKSFALRHTQDGEVAISEHEVRVAREYKNGIELQEGDLVLGASDGFWENFFSSQEIANLIQHSESAAAAVRVLSVEAHRRMEIVRQLKANLLPASSENPDRCMFERDGFTYYIDSGRRVYNSPHSTQVLTVFKADNFSLAAYLHQPSRQVNTQVLAPDATRMEVAPSDTSDMEATLPLGTVASRWAQAGRAVPSPHQDARVDAAFLQGLTLQNEHVLSLAGRELARFFRGHGNTACLQNIHSHLSQVWIFRVHENRYERLAPGAETTLQVGDLLVLGANPNERSASRFQLRLINDDTWFLMNQLEQRPQAEAARTDDGLGPRPPRH